MSLIYFLIIQVLFFGALVFVLHRILSRNVTHATGHLEALGQESMKKEEALKGRLEDTERLRRETLSKAKNEGERLQTEAKQQAADEKARIIAEAHKEAERIVEKANESQEVLKQELAEQTEEKALLRAKEILVSTLPEDIRKKLHEDWMQSLMNNGLAFDQFKPRKDETFQVTSAFPLESKQRNELKEHLKEALKHEVQFKETVDPKLVIGMVVSCGSLVLDGSLRFRIDKAIQEVKRASG